MTLKPCETCGAEKPDDNLFCSDGFHAKGPTYWPCEHCAGTGNANTLPLDGDVVERVARIIDPDAWNKKLPQDGLGLYWTGRRERAREKAEAARAALSSIRDR